MVAPGEYSNPAYLQFVAPPTVPVLAAQAGGGTRRNAASANKGRADASDRIVFARAFISHSFRVRTMRGFYGWAEISVNQIRTDSEN
jgi:hypothetical protein